MIDSTVVRIACTHAARLVGRFGFTGADRDDIQQEILLDYFIRVRRYNLAKSGRRTFLHRVVRNRIATLCEFQSAGCRDYRLCSDSLDAPSGDSIPLEDTVSADAYQDRVGRCATPSWDREELRIDVDRVLATLPSELAAIANMLRSEGVVETAYQLGMPRATLYRRIAEIRIAFRSAELNLYLNLCGATLAKRSRRSLKSCLSGGSRRDARTAR